MSSVIVNKIDLDLVDINIEQTGEAQTDMFFQEPVLDHTRDYVVAVSELSIPIQEEPMLSNNVKNSKLLYIRRKINGQDIDHVDVDILKNGQEDRIATLRVGNKRLSTPADFIREINKFFYRFSKYFEQAVSATYPAVVKDSEAFKIKTEFSPSGILSIKAPGTWWNEFFIEFDPYGIELLGINKSQFVVVPGPGLFDRYFLQVSRSGVATTISNSNMFLANGNFVYYPAASPAWASNHTRTADHSMLRYIEHRIRIELDADLSIPANILIENGVQKMHYNIGSFPIKHAYTGSVTMDLNDSLLSKVGIESPVNIGNVIVKSRLDSTTDWYTISNASNVQNMRLNVIMLRREWNRVKGVWELVRNRIIMDPKASWNATLKFVQTF